jgi:hypothetical protein
MSDNQPKKKLTLEERILANTADYPTGTYTYLLNEEEHKKHVFTCIGGYCMCKNDTECDCVAKLRIWLNR